MSPENPKEISGFVTRHAQSAKHEQPDPKYTSLTPKGVEQARERARSEVLEMIQGAPKDAVIFIGGSDQLRTKETGEVYGEELGIMREDLKNTSDVEVIPREEFEKFKELSYALALREIEGIIKANPDKKVVVDFPMRLWGFSYGHKTKDEKGRLVGEPRWIDERTKKASDFFATLVKEHGNDEGGRIWLRQGGEYTDQSGRVLKGPEPIEVAKEYFASLVKLQKFAKKHSDRPLIIGGVGHSWDIDALATWLSLGCPESVDNEKFYRRFAEISQGGKIINETEMMQFEINANRVKLKYRGKEYLTPYS